MTDDIWRREEIESPCVKICMIHPTAGVCVGCGRTGDEIASWSRLTPQVRREVMAALPDRMASLGDPANRPSARRRTRGR